ncbi:MAG TPA: J domain-containing protein [Hymenobacter sp.]
MTHYQALELPETATPEDIRRAYRRLVLLTHPDRTPDPAAHARYLAVNAAYETLSDPARRQAYDAAMRQPAPSAQPTRQTGRARDESRRAARRPRPQTALPVPLIIRYAAEYALTQRIAKPFMVLALLFVSSLAADYFLATARVEQVDNTESVLYYTGSRRSRHAELYYIHSTARGEFVTEFEIPAGTRLLVRRTPLWRSVVALESTQTQHEVGFRKTYAAPYVMLLLLMSVAAALALWPRYHADKRLMASLLTVTLLVALAYQLLRY